MPCIMTPSRHSGAIETTEIVIMTDAANDNENGIVFLMVWGLKQNTTAAPKQVDAPAIHDSTNGKTQESDGDDDNDTGLPLFPS